MIELLESRTFLSATGLLSQVKQLRGDESSIKADIIGWTKSGAANFARVEGDLVRLKLLKMDKALIGQYAGNGRRGLTKLLRDSARDVAMVNAKTTAFIVAGLKAKKFPLNQTFAATLVSDRATLNQAVTSLLADIASDTSNQITSISSVLSSIGTSVGSDKPAQADITAASIGVNANAQTVSTQLSAVNTDTAAILAAFPG